MVSQTPHCRTCGAEVSDLNRFCPHCGELYPAATNDAAPTLAGELLDQVETLRPMLADKAALGRRLEELAAASRERPLTAEERREWEQSYTRWREIAFEVTLLVDGIHRRAEADRRVGEPQPPSDGPRRSGEDRRDPFWNRAPGG